MFCRKCGAQNTEGTTFCTKCGANQEADAARAHGGPVARSAARGAIGKLVGIAVSVAITFAGAFAINSLLSGGGGGGNAPVHVSDAADSGDRTGRAEREPGPGGGRILIGETQRQRGASVDVEVTLEYVEFVDSVPFLLTDTQIFPEDGNVFLRAVLTVNNLHTQHFAGLGWNQVIYDGRFLFEGEVVDGPMLGGMDPLSPPQTRRVTFEVPRRIMESDNSIALRVRDTSASHVDMLFVVRGSAQAAQPPATQPPHAAQPPQAQPPASSQNVERILGRWQYRDGDWGYEFLAGGTGFNHIPGQRRDLSWEVEGAWEELLVIIPHWSNRIIEYFFDVVGDELHLFEFDPYADAMVFVRVDSFPAEPRPTPPASAPTMVGVWILTSTTGNPPWDLPERITFEGGDSSGTGFSYGALAGIRNNFTWSITGDWFEMEAFPPFTSLPGAVFNPIVWLEVDVESGTLTIAYTGGSTATFTRR